MSSEALKRAQEQERVYAARAREQRLANALADIAGRHPHANPGEHPAVDIARAALADQPAADEVQA